ncbi:beta-xylosidase/alpha-L-arabinofuranosidase 2-like [Bradysia coprophila]|uniref:beta-xylosidase/alpha-L-arabinofuranosidase 2-like n=1 Tax=Bradysia coprophila TaxID=38358 RepID=UPI00187D9CA8|nr:beta-xylosidase/alpha-L-arabinofuranosidase 2-like [Bradysia coprophila]
MNRKKLTILLVLLAAVVVVAIVLAVVLTRKSSAESLIICEKSKNRDLLFCDPSLPIDSRVLDLVGHLTLQEKIFLLEHQSGGASQNVQLDYYNWWNEALHGVAWNYEYVGTFFRPPTEYSTVFPQIISLSASFDKELFFRMANATGNEVRAFHNAGNAGLTFWSPNVNIFRDPRWGRGQETPGEDPYLNAEYARMFVNGFQGDESKVGFLKASACCKHFAAHSIEEGRDYFDAVVTDQDMADTYLPAFKACVENNVTSIMTAYNAINGIPVTADKYYITDLIRGQWGFDGYIVSDCGAVDDVYFEHKYLATPSSTCNAVLHAGLDVECGTFFTRLGYLEAAITEGLVTEQMLDTALSRGFRVLMRLGYFEREDKRPYKEIQSEDADSEYHKQLSLEAAERSIVLLKNIPNESTGIPMLPVNRQDFDTNGAVMALIGPHLNASTVFLGNYHGIPSSIKVPLNEIQNFVPNLKWEAGCDVDTLNNARLDEAEELARTSSRVILFVGITTEVEGENGDRDNISLPGLQPELIRRVLAVAQDPVILIVISGGAIDLSDYKNDSRVGAIIWAGYLGQSGGEAIANVLFGNYNPSGRLTQTFYDNLYLERVSKQDMNMRPVNDSPGRTYRFYTGEAVYPFAHGLSYSTFQYTFSTDENIQIPQFADYCIELNLVVRNVGQRSGDHSVLLFVSSPDAGRNGRPIKSLCEFKKLHNVLPSHSEEVRICLRPAMFELANERGEFEVVLGEWSLIVGDLTKVVTVIE